MSAPREEVTSPEDEAFEFFAQAMGSGSVRDPYPRFAELRAEAEVYRGELPALFGIEAPGAVLSESNEYYTALSYDAVSRVLLDDATFSSSGYAPTMGLVMGHSILEMDEPEHHRYRSLIQQAFNPRAMERWERELVRPIVERRIDRFASRGRADLIRELTFPFPLEVIAGMMGLPEEDLPQFHRWAVELISISFDIERGFAASTSLREYFGRILGPRRTKPGEDLISVLAQAKLDRSDLPDEEGGATELSDEDIYAFLRLLLPAGAETTYRSSSNLLFGLLTHPDQLDALRTDRSLLRPAIEEGLRWEAPLTGIARQTLRETDLCGVHLPAGAVVGVCLGAANRDPARFEDPDRFDIHRSGKQHMAFAYGVHTCLGMHLARMETRVALELLFDRLPNLRLDPEAQDVHISGLGFRAPKALPVLFDPC